MSGMTALDPALDGLEPPQSIEDAARTVLEIRLGAVAKLLARAADGAARDVECIHQLRVATRRAAAALAVFADCCDEKSRRQARKTLTRIRRAATRARQIDVHRALLRDFAHNLPERLQPWGAALADWIARDRKSAGRAVARLAGGKTAARLAALSEKLVRTIDAPPAAEAAAPTTLGSAAAETLPRLVTDLRTAAAGDLRNPEAMHELRLCGKRLRYALEIFSSCVTAGARETIYPALKQMQDHLGEINDTVEIVASVDALLARCRAGRTPRRLRALRQPGGEFESAAADILHRLRRQLVRKTREFLRWRRSQSAEPLLVDLSRPGEEQAPRPEAPPSPPEHHVPRVAAIDVGTNSIRLVVAEAAPGGGYRIIDDEKETTRLGRGLFTSGRLTMGAMKRSVRAIERMHQIARAYHVDLLRAVGTAAVREAQNGDEFIALVKHRADIDLEMISADTEARLAHASVSNAFDLSEADAAIVDIGGGSTEIVLAAHGVIDSVHTLPLGAVRLSDIIRGGAEDPLVFADLHNHIDAVIAAGLERPANPPRLLIGTGGTFTTLAKILVRRGGGDGTGGRFPFDLRGLRVRRDQVGALLHEMRRTPLRERQRIPGLSPARAEIIIEGFAIVDRLMDFLCVDELRVHDGGIRDGLLIQMIEEHGLAGAGPSMASDRLAQVRRFAEACRYDRQHAIQVARLALRIFDQLSASIGAGEPWTGPENRDLLHMAALLHDVGCVIDIPRHHKHSYDMILDSRLKDFSRRELAIIANLSRYHRRALPSVSHRGYRRLGETDRRCVGVLSAILRVADGLDRLHRQEVRGVSVAFTDRRATFAVDAAVEPTENLRAAAKKSDLFAREFGVDVEIRWKPQPAASESLPLGDLSLPRVTRKEP